MGVEYKESSRDDVPDEGSQDMADQKYVRPIPCISIGGDGFRNEIIYQSIKFQNDFAQDTFHDGFAAFCEKSGNSKQSIKLDAACAENHRPGYRPSG